MFHYDASSVHKSIRLCGLHFSNLYVLSYIWASTSVLKGPKSFPKTNITFLSKPDKQNTDQKNGPIFTYTCRCKLLYKILPSKIQRHLERIIHYDEEGLVPRI